MLNPAAEALIQIKPAERRGQLKHPGRRLSMPIRSRPNRIGLGGCDCVTKRLVENREKVALCKREPDGTNG
jgi:hypothetical protein